ncbi:MAG: biotin/lipoyl-containing protein [Pseudomonadota bacterium]
MKMEYAINAPCPGVVKTIFYQVDDLVNEGALLLEFEPATTD